jgi:hypothetical protein
MGEEDEKVGERGGRRKGKMKRERGIKWGWKVGWKVGGGKVMHAEGWRSAPIKQTVVGAKG